ncbi:MAG: hypothetical protein R3247_12015 [Rhodothermales bacterium]|nr:hypothetical protein [Rhodothermales bacterium]
MTNRIDAYLSARLDPYVQPSRQAPAPREAAPAAAPAQAAAPSTPAAEGLSRGEQQLIDRYFPASETLTLRLYGARGSAETLRPAALGSRLDLTG